MTKIGKSIDMEYGIDMPNVSGVTDFMNRIFNQQPSALNVLERLKTLGDAKSGIEKKYRHLSCYTHLYYPNNSYGRMSLYFSLTAFDENDEASLEPALKELFDAVGTPYIVHSESDYELAEKVLKQYGKTFERGWLDKFFGKPIIGRTVIDI